MSDSGTAGLLPHHNLEATEIPDTPTFFSRFCSGFWIWVNLLVKFVASSFAAVFLGIGVAAFPIVYIIPNCALNGAFKIVFKIAYTVYVFTPLGRVIHLQMVKARRKSHAQSHTINIHPTTLSSCDVIPIPILADNYAYLIIDHATREAAVVDPADPELTQQTIERRKVKLTTILTTHRHHDHAGGNIDLKKMYPNIEVVGGKKDGCAAVTKPVEHNDVLRLGNTQITVLDTPCHTHGHVCYVVCGPCPSPHTTPPPSPMASSRGSSSPFVGERVEALGEALFSGDTLFIGGVGALFHGNEADMHRCLSEGLADVPDSCQVFCGHEYTLENVRFAEWLEPRNAALAARVKWVVERRARKEPTVPQTLGSERRLNPFMRVKDPQFAYMATQRLAKLRPPSCLQRARSKPDAYRLSPPYPPAPDQPPLEQEAASNIMRALQKLMGCWAESAEHLSQKNPCCLHGTCLRPVTCQGVVARLRSESVACQTDRLGTLPPLPRRPAPNLDHLRACQSDENTPSNSSPHMLVLQHALDNITAPNRPQNQMAASIGDVQALFAASSPNSPSSEHRGGLQLGTSPTPETTAQGQNEAAEIRCVPVGSELPI